MNTNTNDVDTKVRAVRQLGMWVVYFHRARILTCHKLDQAEKAVSALKPFDTGHTPSPVRINTLKAAAMKAITEAA